MFVLAHLSDLHLAAPPRLAELAGKRGLGFINWHRGRKNIHRVAALDALTADLKTLAADHVAVTGDLVNLSLPNEYRRARAWLDALGTPSDVTVIPGNHDIYVPGALDGPSTFWGDYMRGDNGSGRGAFPFVRRRGDVALAIAPFERARDLCLRHDVPLWRPVFAAFLGYSLALTARFAEAESLLREALEQSALMRMGSFHSQLVMWLSEARLLMGEVGDAGKLADDALEMGRHEFETNVFGPLAMSRGFAPVLDANGGGAIINVLSVLSWLSVSGGAMYCASKAAAWSLTNALRLDLLDQHTQVVALHVGYMDTDMAAGVDAPKASPDDVAGQALVGVEAGAFEVLADDEAGPVAVQRKMDAPT
jgi:NAD(P)-dependent dehydrogenase (short-subunit alcohol dehydrogenase family)